MVAFIQGTAKTIRRDIQARVLANRIRRGTTLSRHLVAQIEALELPRLDTTLSEAVAYGGARFLARAAHDRAGGTGNRRACWRNCARWHGCRRPGALPICRAVLRKGVLHGRPLKTWHTRTDQTRLRCVSSRRLIRQSRRQ